MQGVFMGHLSFYNKNQISLDWKIKPALWQLKMAIKGLVYFFYSPFQGMIYWLYRLLSAGKGADMNYYNASGQMDLSDRIAIETGICIGESFKKIAKRLRRHPSTIAHEVKENRTFIKGNYPNGKDCSKVRHCTPNIYGTSDSTFCMTNPAFMTPSGR